ncbi:hypothetical protein H4R35_005641 [Dimargaris xerosporica]|nr:hypothetical protein H4R35_005641 [Dimargaris xerosporica]
MALVSWVRRAPLPLEPPGALVRRGIAVALNDSSNETTFNSAASAPTVFPDPNVQPAARTNEFLTAAGFQHANNADASTLTKDSSGAAIRRWSVGLHSILPQDKRPPLALTTFQVLSTGPGAMLLAQLPPFAVVYAVPGTVIGRSPSVVRSVTVRRDGASSWANQAQNLVTGQRLRYERLATEQRSGDALLSVQAQGDMGVLNLGGSTDYYVHPHAVSALTAGLRLTTATGTRHAMGFWAAQFYRRVSGRGSLVLSATGGIHRIVLDRGEAYAVDPDYILAWDAALELVPDSLAVLEGDQALSTSDAQTSSPTDQMPATTKPLPNTTLHWLRYINPRYLYKVLLRQTLHRDTLLPPDVHQTLARVFRPVVIVGQTAGAMLKRAIQRLLRPRPTLLLYGPGDVYITTRLPPKSFFRQMKPSQLARR